MKKFYLFISLFIWTLCPATVIGQGWHWDWAESASAHTSTLFQITAASTDTLNNIYCQIPYMTGIYFPDTSFQHQGNQYSQNFAVAIYSEKGEFKKALDIHTNPDRFLWSPSMVTDKMGNIYVAGSFQDRVFIQDSVIDHGEGIDPNIPDMYLAKLSPELKVLWTRKIWGTSQSFPCELAMDEGNNVYLGVGNYGNGADSMQVWFLGQDSSTYLTTLNSFMKINPDGNLLWRKEILSSTPATNGVKVFLGDDGNVYFRGDTSRDFILDGDTVHMPPGVTYGLPFLLCSDQDGKILRSSIIDWSMYIIDMKVGSGGDIYISGRLNDTLVFGQDTITVRPDSSAYILGRTTADLQPEWHHVVKTADYAAFMNFNVYPDGDTLYFSTTANRKFTLDGTQFDIGYYSEAFSGCFSPEGHLMRTFVTECNMDLNCTSMMLDNCKNMLIAGYFWTQANFGPDSLKTFYLYRDVFISRFQNHTPPAFDLGLDTIVCNGIVLHGPPGYARYVWNHGESSESSFPVTKSGNYRLDVADENYCWMADSVNVKITIMPPVNIGSDTTIYRKDSLKLNAGPGYEHYEWSTGDTVYAITIHGSDLGAGTWTISCEATEGPCTGRDSITLTILNNPGMEEPEQSKLKIHPNPSGGIFYLDLPCTECSVQITNANGLEVTGISLTNENNGRLKIDLTSQPPGVYFVKVMKQEMTLTGKIVRI
ncbi:MAG: T9SS type A sorting domain-containing protein [bacterium]